MKNTIIFSLPENEQLTGALSQTLAIEVGNAVIREFPDNESYIRIDSDVKNKTAVLVCTLNAPNPKFLPVIFMAQTLKELGVKQVILIAPYLSYMRQDKRFQAGEAVTSILFSQLLSHSIDGLITIDPHLHRIAELSEIYNIPNIVTLHATTIISDWIIKHIQAPLLIGPDDESRQWVAEIAALVNCPFIVGQKNRISDKQVIVSLPETEHQTCTPVLIDDIVSTGASMLETLKLLNSRGFEKPICIGVHALFNQDTAQKLRLAGAEKVITCNTIPHSTNQIDITAIVAKGLQSIASDAMAAS